MMRLTKRQIDAFGAQRRERFIDDLKLHVESSAPGRGPQVPGLVQLAERLDLETELEIASFVELFTFFGLAVDDTRVTSILDAEGLSASDKVIQLEALTQEPAAPGS